MQVQKFKKNMCTKKIIWNSSTCTCDNSKYLETIFGHPVIMCDELIDVKKTLPTVPTKTIPSKTVPTDFSEEKVTRKIESFPPFS